MKRLASVVLFLGCLSLAAQERGTPPKPIKTFNDLEAGMSREYVVVRLLDSGLYTLKKTVGSADGKGFEAWDIFLPGGGDISPYFGEMVFQNGKLWTAAHRLFDSRQEHSDFGQGFDLAEILLSDIRNNSKLVDEQPPLGSVAAFPEWKDFKPSTRQTMAFLETTNTRTGKLEHQTLKIQIGSKLFVLTIEGQWTDDHQRRLPAEPGKSTPMGLSMTAVVMLDEVVVPPSKP